SEMCIRDRAGLLHRARRQGAAGGGLRIGPSGAPPPRDDALAARRVPHSAAAQRSRTPRKFSGSFSTEGPILGLVVASLIVLFRVSRFFDGGTQA
ncbi:hypothetical protein, partial [Glycomyces tenuis]|uniref:hypothetical protein n=1 Tax=Glycomyces tenuis TaxID=58116 RepID=UPI001B807D7D